MIETQHELRSSLNNGNVKCFSSNHKSLLKSLVFIYSPYPLPPKYTHIWRWTSGIVIKIPFGMLTFAPQCPGSYPSSVPNFCCLPVHNLGGCTWWFNNWFNANQLGSPVCTLSSWFWPELPQTGRAPWIVRA